MTNVWCPGSQMLLPSLCPRAKRSPSPLFHGCETEEWDTCPPVIPITVGTPSAWSYSIRGLTLKFLTVSALMAPSYGMKFWVCEKHSFAECHVYYTTLLATPREPSSPPPQHFQTLAAPRMEASGPLPPSDF